MNCRLYHIVNIVMCLHHDDIDHKEWPCVHIKVAFTVLFSCLGSPWSASEPSIEPEGPGSTGGVEDNYHRNMSWLHVSDSSLSESNVLNISVKKKFCLIHSSFSTSRSWFCYVTSRVSSALMWISVTLDAISATAVPVLGSFALSNFCTVRQWTAWKRAALPAASVAGLRRAKRSFNIIR